MSERELPPGVIPEQDHTEEEFSYITNEIPHAPETTSTITNPKNEIDSQNKKLTVTPISVRYPDGREEIELLDEETGTLVVGKEKDERCAEIMKDIEQRRKFKESLAALQKSVSENEEKRKIKKKIEDISEGEKARTNRYLTEQGIDPNELSQKEWIENHERLEEALRSKYENNINEISLANMEKRMEMEKKKTEILKERQKEEVERKISWLKEQLRLAFGGAYTIVISPLEGASTALAKYPYIGIPSASGIGGLGAKFITTALPKINEALAGGTASEIGLQAAIVVSGSIMIGTGANTILVSIKNWGENKFKKNKK